jgi:antitoxin VapB
MSLNIKDEETHKLAQALARETGQSMTKAVTQALRDQLEIVRRRKRKGNMAEDLLAIGRRFSRRVRKPVVPHDELLYDERGLPR